MDKPRTHFHFIVQAYAQRLPEGQLIDVATLDLIASNSAEALDRARCLVEREHYRVSQVIEYRDGGCH